MTELIISIVAILLILYLGKAGATYGLFFELISTVLLLFAMLVALRYWYVVTQFVQSSTPISGSYAAFVAYWVLFLLGCVPLLAVMKLVNDDSLPKYPNILDNLLGFVFGAASAAIFICALMTSVSVIMPKLWEQYDNGALLIPLDKAPIAAFQHIERNWYGITTNNPSYTRFPTFKKADADNFEQYWR